MDHTRKIICRSNYWYNDGLKKAQVRDMSGAQAALRRSLGFDRGNVAARNLLGLVYYGIGEISSALVQWIISKNIQPVDNIAAYYIDTVEKSSGELKAIDEAVKRYNRALALCGSYETGAAQEELKKAVAAHPSFLRAQQLLALIYLHEGQYKKARQALRAARKLDKTNVTTLSYIHELSLRRFISAAKEDVDEGTAAAENEPAVAAQPRAEDTPKTDTAIKRKRAKYVISGAAAAALAMWFLVFPAACSGRTAKQNRQLIEFSERFNAMEAQISAQSRALDEYRRDSTDSATTAQNAALVIKDYENLMGAKAQWDSGGYSEDAVSRTLLLVRRDFLGEAGKGLYDELAQEIYPTAADVLYRSGSESFEAENYEGAADCLDKVVKMYEDYESGEALLMLGVSLARNGDADRALGCLKRVVELFPDTQQAASAKNEIKKMPH